MTQTPYMAAAHRILDHLAGSQGAAIEAAATLIVEALSGGGGVYCHEIGHSIQMDFINRAGGLCAVHPFTFSWSVNCPVPEVRRKSQSGADADADLAVVRQAVAQSALRAGDVMLVGSVSGRNRRPVELALACRERGVKVIAFTALDYTRRVTSLHPSGWRLFEAADVVIDNGAPYGDAGVEVPGYEVKLIPLSGLGMLAAGWLIWEQVMTRMAAAQTPASILISQNRDDGPAFNAASRARYQERGY